MSRKVDIHRAVLITRHAWAVALELAAAHGFVVWDVAAVVELQGQELAAALGRARESMPTTDARRSGLAKLIKFLRAPGPVTICGSSHV